MTKTMLTADCISANHSGLFLYFLLARKRRTKPVNHLTKAGSHQIDIRLLLNILLAPPFFRAQLNRSVLKTNPSFRFTGCQVERSHRPPIALLPPFRLSATSRFFMRFHHSSFNRALRASDAQSLAVVTHGKQRTKVIFPAPSKFTITHGIFKPGFRQGRGMDTSHILVLYFSMNSRYYQGNKGLTFFPSS